MMPRRQRKPSLKVREMQQAETDTQVPYLSEDKVGRWYKIVAATKEQNAGEYECSVNVTLDEYPGKPLDSEVAVINLTVYGMLYIHVLHLSLNCFALRCTLDDTSI